MRLNTSLVFLAVLALVLAANWTVALLGCWFLPAAFALMNLLGATGGASPSTRAYALAVLVAACTAAVFGLRAITKRGARITNA